MKGMKYMQNAWLGVPISDYEAHMSFEGVEQLQALNQILSEQLDAFDTESVMILGITGGNGLEHIDTAKIKEIIGIDINPEYLAVCKERHAELGTKLRLMNMDVTSAEAILPHADLVIANMFLEYVNLHDFARKLIAAEPVYFSCTYQQEKTSGIQFVSSSPYADVFDDVSELHSTVAADEVKREMSEIGMALTGTTEYPLPNGKAFVRLDFAQKEAVAGTHSPLSRFYSQEMNLK
jgi:predicted RNA methylase